MAKLNKYQAKANEVYPDGFIETAADEGERAGDTLALFIYRELSDADSVDEAVRLMQTAHDEIATVLGALAKMEK